MLAEYGEVRSFARAGDEVEVVFAFPELEAELLETFADMPRMPGYDQEDEGAANTEPFEVRVRFGADDGLPRALRATFETREQGVQFKLRFDLTDMRVDDMRGRPYRYEPDGRGEVPLDAVLEQLTNELDRQVADDDLPF